MESRNFEYSADVTHVYPICVIVKNPPKSVYPLELVPTYFIFCNPCPIMYTQNAKRSEDIMVSQLVHKKL